MIFRFVKVVPPGIEPGTQGFSVLCSTNWAMAPSLLLVCGCKDRRFLWFSQVFSHFSWKKCTSFRKLQYLCTRNSGFSAVGSALRSGRRGRWFESSNPDSKRWKGYCFPPLFSFPAVRFAAAYAPPCSHACNALTPNALWKAANCIAKGRQLHAKRPPFAGRKAAFCGSSAVQVYGI